MSETAKDMEARVAAMANSGDGGTWDLSPNDCAALAHVVEQLTLARERVRACEEQIFAGGVEIGVKDVEIERLRTRVSELEESMRTMRPDLGFDGGQQQ